MGKVGVQEVCIEGVRDRDAGRGGGRLRGQRSEVTDQ